MDVRQNCCARNLRNSTSSQKVHTSPSFSRDSSTPPKAWYRLLHSSSPLNFDLKRSLTLFTSCSSSRPRGGGAKPNGMSANGASTSAAAAAPSPPESLDSVVAPFLDFLCAQVWASAITILALISQRHWLRLTWENAGRPDQASTSGLITGGMNDAHIQLSCNL
jgi:hypothetical protein